MGDLSVEKDIVLVTGFGPFGTHVVNASWVAVQSLEKMGISDSIDLIIKHVPVEYDTVKEMVPKLWEEFKPKLMIHVGVSGIARALTLEQCAYNIGYDKYDIKWRLPPKKCCIEGAPDTVQSRLDMSVVKDAVNCSKCGVKAVVSYDPGRYLCDFIYFTSLSVGPGPAAFIHVPPLNKPYSAEQLADGIRLAIMAMLEQLT